MRRLRQAGAALILAMLTVALVATFAAAALWQQWRSIEVETAERARVQSGWLLTGALDWARLLLREDARPGQASATVDHLGEPWAVPLQEARLSSFLAADKNVSNDLGPQVLDAFLSGQLTDAQSMLNVRNLVLPNGTPDPDAYKNFAVLFQLLGLPTSELDLLANNLRFAYASTMTDQPSPMAPLPPRDVEQLAWLDVRPQTVAALQPYVIVLPQRTKVNVNTAAAEVIAAAANLDLADAQRLVKARESNPFHSYTEITNMLPTGAAPPGVGIGLDVRSEFFIAQARLRLDNLVVEERSLLQRNGTTITVVHRQRGLTDPTAVTPAGAGARR